MKSEIEAIYNQAINAIEKVSDGESLEALRIDYLGRKKGKLTLLMKEIPNLSIAEKREIGPLINKIKNDITLAFDKKEKILGQVIDSKNSFFDITLPGEKFKLGTLHPITQVRLQVEKIFQKMGFEVLNPREIDDDYHVFTSLNLPPQHPARDMWDTFWTENDFIPITHTSSMQNRAIRERTPPFGVIVPGRCFRHEATDAHHEHTFYQVEGLYVGENINLSHLIGTILTFLQEYFQKELRYKIQPSYFPFVEPGLEFLVSCVMCDGKGEKDKIPCSTCRHSGWLELIPCGLTHPKVLEMGGLDPKKYSGFAWGMGLDRLVMLKYGIEDIRHFHAGDLRFLKQF